MEDFDQNKMALSWFTRSWDDYLGGFATLLPVLLAQAALSSGTFLLIHHYHSFWQALPYMFLVLTPVSTGISLVYIHLSRSGTARFRDMFSAFPVYHRAIAVSLGVALATFGGMLMFIIPGVVLYLTFCFSEYAVVDRRTGIKESFALSRNITGGWKSRLLPIFLLVVMANLLIPDIVTVTGKMQSPAVSLTLTPWTIVAAFLKTFVFLPWLNMAMARAYNFLLAAPVAVPEPAQAPGA